MSIRSVLKRGLRYIVSGVPNIIVRPQIFYSNSSGKLKGKKILLTGGSRGLGYAMAKKFVEEGAQVIITGRKLDTLKEASEQIGCKFIVFDVTDTNKYEDLIRKAEEELGGLNVLVNNAGISLHEPSFFDVTLESFDRQINTNLKSDVFLSQCFIKRMIEEKREATILCVSSEVGDLADNRPYGWTKSAINSVVRGLASNFSKEGIRINAISPGITCSKMTGLDPKKNLYIRTNATERAYLPEEIAEVASFLISDLSGCISGQVIVCNNGKTIYTREKIEKNG